jgi:hypothetical protein
MTKCRIIERTCPDGSVSYVIQQKHFLFRWWWVDAWVNSWDGAWCQDTFPSLEEAVSNLCYFDGTPSKCVVVFEGGSLSNENSTWCQGDDVLP